MNARLSPVVTGRLPARIQVHVRGGGSGRAQVAAAVPAGQPDAATTRMGMRTRVRSHSSSRSAPAAVGSERIVNVSTC
jgi:hypothetical protein